MQQSQLFALTINHCILVFCQFCSLELLEFLHNISVPSAEIATQIVAPLNDIETQLSYSGDSQFQMSLWHFLEYSVKISLSSAATEWKSRTGTAQGILNGWSLRRIKATEYWQHYYLLVYPLLHFELIKYSGKFLVKETIQLAEASCWKADREANMWVD